MTDKKNQVKHHAGGYSPLFDMGDTDGSGEGGYQYLWDNDLRSYFQTVPDNLLYKVSGQPVVYFWSDNTYAFTNQGNGNPARMLQYVRSQAQSEFGRNPYFVVDNSWLKNGSAVSAVANGANSWFGVPSPSYQPDLQRRVLRRRGARLPLRDGHHQHGDRPESRTDPGQQPRVHRQRR
jgi:hypothetical protein